MFRHILCPIDGSVTSLQALDVAARLAADQHARLTICSVVDPSQAAAMAFGDPAMSARCYEALDDEAKQMLRDAAGRVAPPVSAESAALNGQPVPAIVDYANANACDLIVMGSHGRSGIRRALVGSVAEGVLRHAGAPVMVIRWSGHAEKEPATKAAASAIA